MRPLSDPSQERSAVQADPDLAGTGKDTSLHVDSVTAEIMAGLDNIQQVIEEGSVAEAKAIPRRHIAKIGYVPGRDKARIGFYDLPVRALLFPPRPSGRGSRSAGLSSRAGEQ